MPSSSIRASADKVQAPFFRFSEMLLFSDSMLNADWCVV